MWGSEERLSKSLAPARLGGFSAHCPEPTRVFVCARPSSSTSPARLRVSRTQRKCFSPRDVVSEVKSPQSGDAAPHLHGTLSVPVGAILEDNSSLARDKQCLRGSEFLPGPARSSANPLLLLCPPLTSLGLLLLAGPRYYRPVVVSSAWLGSTALTHPTQPPLHPIRCWLLEMLVLGPIRFSEPMRSIVGFPGAWYLRGFALKKKGQGVGR